MRTRRGFTLLEVMISLAILITSMAILFQTQGTAALMTAEAEHLLVATQLAQEKMAEVQFLVENEGFQQDDVFEEGDFDDFGDEALDIQMKNLEEYHYEFLVTEIDLSQAGDLSAMMNQAMGSMSTPGSSTAPASLPSLPISTDMIVEMLDPFIREVKVRVWWGDDVDKAEELGNEVVLVTHMIQPHGNMLANLPGGGMGSAAGGGAGNASGPAGAGRGVQGRDASGRPNSTPFSNLGPVGGGSGAPRAGGR
jgi:prepilin-type N-terminal cleavage/methylation domain-containing protein